MVSYGGISFELVEEVACEHHPTTTDLSGLIGEERKRPTLGQREGFTVVAAQHSYEEEVEHYPHDQLVLTVCISFLLDALLLLLLSPFVVAPADLALLLCLFGCLFDLFAKFDKFTLHLSMLGKGRGSVILIDRGLDFRFARLEFLHLFIFGKLVWCEGEEGVIEPFLAAFGSGIDHVFVYEADENSQQLVHVVLETLALVNIQI
jgi:hypothetical protein